VKLRKTIYPIALIIGVPLVFIVFYMLNQGKFTFEDTAVQEYLVDGHHYTVYAMKWKGYGNPMIESVILLEKPNDEVTPYILQQSQVTEAAIQELKPVKNIRLTSHQFYFVLKTEQGNEALYEPSLEIYSKTFGINRKQELLME
jgi:hypothetical protein